MDAATDDALTRLQFTSANVTRRAPNGQYVRSRGGRHRHSRSGEDQGHVSAAAWQSRRAATRQRIHIQKATALHSHQDVFVHRRSLDTEQGVSQISVEEAVSREDVHVAFICTDNVQHEDSVRTFLQAGKHVCVEYPMTTNYKAAVELWALAQEKGGVVKPGFGFPAFSGIARLTWLVDLFGELSVISATVEDDDSGNHSKMTTKLMTCDKRPLTWIEERGPGLPRAKNINFQFDSCTLTQIPPAPRGAVGLFMQDLIHFSAKLVDQVSPEEIQRERVRILHCLELAEKIQRLCQS
ncbi:hypothetical protein F2P81_001093 [Scophthalmus maximus]|uniref:Biliverdin reductase catalytic domain-containing protein n=1 Tax=Scophthalmus maximus TaxID=52904 RepID=A0A6A4TUY2_SCOMX|nr:hypothetical protein F2P81_001093 [Scophthalmus maximus]